MPTGDQPLLGDLRGWLFTAGAGGRGRGVGPALRLPAAMLLGPMILAGIVTLAIPGGSFGVPPPLREVAFALIGLQVGLRFTRRDRARGRAAAVPVLACVRRCSSLCFGLGGRARDDDRRQPARRLSGDDAGRPLRGARDRVRRGTDTTFVIATQGLRVIVMVLLAPVAIRALVGRPATVR